MLEAAGFSERDGALHITPSASAWVPLSEAERALSARLDALEAAAAPAPAGSGGLGGLGGLGALGGLGGLGGLGAGGLGGLGGLGGAGGPAGLQQMMARAQEELSRNPELQAHVRWPSGIEARWP